MESASVWTSSSSVWVITWLPTVVQAHHGLGVLAGWTMNYLPFAQVSSWLALSLPVLNSPGCCVALRGEAGHAVHRCWWGPFTGEFTMAIASGNTRPVMTSVPTNCHADAYSSSSVLCIPLLYLSDPLFELSKLSTLLTGINCSLSTINWQCILLYRWYTHHYNWQ